MMLGAVAQVNSAVAFVRYLPGLDESRLSVKKASERRKVLTNSPTGPIFVILNG